MIKQTAGTFVAVLVIIVASSSAVAAIVSVGSGTAVDDVDRTADFNDIVQLQSLDGYTHDQLIISVDSTSHIYFDPTNGNGGFSGAFHYPGSGVTHHLTSISAEDGAEIYAVEMNVGTGWHSTTTYVYWELIDDAIVIDSGAISLDSGAVLGLNEPDGFDELHIGAFATFELAEAATGATLGHSLAIDNLVADLTIPEPTSLSLLALGTALFLRRR